LTGYVVCCLGMSWRSSGRQCHC